MSDSTSFRSHIPHLFILLSVHPRHVCSLNQWNTTSYNDCYLVCSLNQWNTTSCNDCYLVCSLKEVSVIQYTCGENKRRLIGLGAETGWCLKRDLVDNTHRKRWMMKNNVYCSVDIRCNEICINLVKELLKMSIRRQC